MTRTTTPRPFDTGLAIGGAVLVALAGLLGAIGTSLGLAAFVGAARRWQRGTEMSTGELARHALLSARAGSTAGVQAWRRTDVPPPRVSRDGSPTPVGTRP